MHYDSGEWYDGELSLGGEPGLRARGFPTWARADIRAINLLRLRAPGGGAAAAGAIEHAAAAAAVVVPPLSS